MTEYRILAYIDKFDVIVEEFIEDSGALYHFDRIYLCADPGILKLDKETFERKDILRRVIDRFLDYALCVLAREGVERQVYGMEIDLQPSEHPKDLLTEIALGTVMTIDGKRYKFEREHDGPLKWFVLQEVKSK